MPGKQLWPLWTHDIDLDLIGILQPERVLAWLMGEGAWFANTYQAIGLVWILALFIFVVRQTTGRGWLASVLLGFGTAVVYGIPVGLFIR